MTESLLLQAEAVVHHNPPLLHAFIKEAYRHQPDPCALLPTEHFTLKELQEVHEAVLGEKVQRDSFRRGMLRTGLLEDTGVKTSGVVGKPARLFRKVA